MGTLLAAGAGAADGLDTILARLMAQQQLEQRQKQLDEETRHNQADESLRGRQIDEIGKSRADALAEKKAAQTDKTVASRGIGDNVTEGEYANETGAGFPSGDYKVTPGAKVTKLAGFMSAPGSVSSLTGQGAAPAVPDAGPAAGVDVTQNQTDPLNAPRLINFKGTEAQRLARDKEMQVKPTPDQQKTYAVTDPDLAKSLGLKVGDPIDAMMDPRQVGRITYRGQDVTNQVGHYEKPASPDRVLIQTGTGYETRDQARRDLAAGKDVGLPTTTTTRTMMEGAQMLEPHIAKVQTQAEQLDKAGLFGPVMSRIRQALSKAGSIDEFNSLISSDPTIMNDRAAGRFATSLGLLASGAGRVHGGARGGGSPQMYQAFKELLSDAGTLQMFEGRLDGLNEYMGGYAAGPGGPKTADTAAPAGDLYSQYLARTKK